MLFIFEEAPLLRKVYQMTSASSLTGCIQSQASFSVTSLTDHFVLHACGLFPQNIFQTAQKCFCLDNQKL